VYVWPGLSQSIVYVVRVCGTVKLVWLRLVTRRFVGVVGGVRSLAAAATEPTTTNARTRASAAPAERRTTAFVAAMSFVPVRMPGRAGGRCVPW
jgi:hypothetical protein